MTDAPKPPVEDDDDATPKTIRVANVPPHLHKALKIGAINEDDNLNDYVIKKLADAMHIELYPPEETK